MTTQLAFANPIVHTGDPETSHAAARHLEQSGRRARHIELVVALVDHFPGSTACELWQLADEATRRTLNEMQEVRRRLTDALAGLKVEQGPARRCRVRGTLQVTWWRGA